MHADADCPCWVLGKCITVTQVHQFDVIIIILLSLFLSSVWGLEKNWQKTDRSGHYYYYSRHLPVGDAGGYSDRQFTYIRRFICVYEPTRHKVIAWEELAVVELVGKGQDKQKSFEPRFENAIEGLSRTVLGSEFQMVDVASWKPLQAESVCLMYVWLEHTHTHVE